MTSALRTEGIKNSSNFADSIHLADREGEGVKRSKNYVDVLYDV